MSEQKPSIGRIMIYNHPGSADAKYAPVQSPAIVHKVNENGSVNLAVFDMGKGLWFEYNIEVGDGPSQCNWPARV